MGKVCIKYSFSNVEELEKLLEKIRAEAPSDILIEFDSREEFLEVAKLLLKSRDFEQASLTVGFQQQNVERQKGVPLPKARCSEINEEKVYEVVKAIVESRIREGRPYFMMQDVYVAVCGRPLRVYSNKDDYKIAVKLRRAVKRLLPLIGKELHVRFEEDIITYYEGRAGKFRIFKIVVAT